MALDEPVFDYVVTRGDTLHFHLRVAPGGSPIEWDGYAAEIVVRPNGGGTPIVLTSPDRITLVDPADLADASAPNLVASLTPAETVGFAVEGAAALYQVRLTDPAGDVVTVLKGRIDARFAAAED